MAYTTINKGTAHFDTKLYTGTSGTINVTGLDFQPDFTWIYNRGGTYASPMFDAVRGVTKLIESTGNGGENTVANTLTSFNSDGFTIGADGNNYVNRSSSPNTYVAWNWKMGGSGSANTDGSINSTVSVNSTAKMSIVTFTGTDSNETVGHGLGVAPDVILVKKLTGTSTNWFVFHKGMFDTDSTAYINLNTTDGKSQSATVFQSTAPTSTVFSTGTSVSASDYIAYCFTNTKGFFHSGVYTGNNSTNGAFLYTGFKPSFLITKRYGANGYNWVIQDNKRSSTNGNNPMDRWVYANVSDTEADQTSNPTDFLSNGVKIRNNGSYMNQASDYLYWAFAESPFVGSNDIPTTAR